MSASLLRSRMQKAKGKKEIKKKKKDEAERKQEEK